MNKKAISGLGIAGIIVVGIVVAGLFLFPYSPNNPPVANETGSTQKGIEEVINSNNQFAIDMYNELNSDEKQQIKNIFYSPYSISSALGMTYEGANGKTKEEMKEVFHFPEDNVLRPNFAAIYNYMNEDNEYELRTGNALWIQKNYSIKGDYINRVESYYGGKASNLDFISETEKSRKTINKFIEEQTNNKIKDLISKGTLGSLTRMVLTNAIYFKGDWKWEFDEDDTRRENFKGIGRVDMMYMKPEKARFNYTDTGKLQLLEMPYKGGMSMLVILPKQGKEYDYETGEETNYNYTLNDINFSLENLNKWKSEMKEQGLDRIYFPKFEIDTKYYMKEYLKNLGMNSAFSGNADFSGMTEDELYISEVIHQGYVKVDEKGTEAAAATAVGMEVTAVQPTKIFKADHPFIFIIQDEKEQILFLGKMMNPNE